MKALFHRWFKVPGNNRGFALGYTMMFLTSLTMGTLSLVDMQITSSNDNKLETEVGRARTMATSGLEEAHYYVRKTSPGFTGNMPEQIVTTSDGYIQGSFEYSVVKVGKTVTITSTGYSPQKANMSRAKYTLTKTFTESNPISPKGLLLLGGGGSTAIFNSNAQYYSPLGNIIVKSNANNAMILNSNANINASAIAVVGKYTMGANTHITANIETSYSEPIMDPYASIPEPNTASFPISPQGNSDFNLNSGQNATLQPGRFTGAINLNSNTTVTLSPGIYILEKGFNANSNTTITGNGVMLYNAGGGAFIMSSNATISISAPTSGQYQGFAYFQKRSSNHSVTVNSNAGTGFNGVVYAPGAQLMVNSNGRVVMTGESNVFNSMTMNSNAEVTLTPNIPTEIPLL